MPFTSRDFIDEAQNLADELYPNNGVNASRLGRFHYAIQILFDQYELDDEDIAEQVLDDQNDQGIDFFAIFGGAEHNIFAVQVKDHRQLASVSQIEAVRKLVGELHLLLDATRVVSAWPERRKERYRELRDVKHDEFRVHFVLLLTGGATAEFLDLANFELRANESLSIFGRRELAELEQQHREPRKPKVVLPVSRENTLRFGIEKDVRLLSGIVNAKSYVDATESERNSIFRLNPRLYLGDRPSNRGMLETLRDDTERQRFHLLNNGITVVCENFEVEDDRVIVEDFQVVNGCQTTETLWKFDSESPKKIKETFVSLRIIETRSNEALASRISQTNNSQSAIASSDLVANDEIQKKIKALLENAGTPPIFYEARRGELRHLKKRRVERNKYVINPEDWGRTEAQGYREIALKELAQILLAVTKSPSSAKEQISSLFVDRGPESDYVQLFSSTWTDEKQLRLLIETYLFMRREQIWCPEGRNENERAQYLEMARLGRFYVTYLVFRQWRSDFGRSYNPDTGDLSLLPKEDSEIILGDFVRHVGLLPSLAVKALVRTKGRLKIDTRPLLRNKAYRLEIEDSFDTLLQAAAE
jgi:hypothetical protein